MIGRTALLALGASAAFAAMPAPAQDACRLCDRAPETGSRQSEATRPIAVEVEAGLDFDRLVLLGSGEGSVILRPDGSAQVSGMIGAISPRAMVGRAQVRGEPGRFVRIELPRRVELYSPSGGQLLIDEIVSDLPSAPRLDSSGKLHFRFGGRLRIVGDADGSYRGDLPITVEYL